MTNKQIESILKNYDERLDTLCDLHVGKLAGYDDYDNFYKAIMHAEKIVKDMIFGLYYYDMIDSEKFEEFMDRITQLTTECI